MKNECKIVRDLLPLYAENMVSEETAEFVKEHLANCSACAEELASVQKDDLKEDTTIRVNTAAPLVSVKKKLHRRMVGAISKTTVIVVTITAIVACLLGWRFWPHPFSYIMPLEEDAISNFSVEVHLRSTRYGQRYVETYYTDDQSTELELIMGILNNSSYQQDFRNLMPWSLHEFMADSHNSPKTAAVEFITRDPKDGSVDRDKSVQFVFTDNNTIVVTDGNMDVFYVYNLTNSVVLDMLVEFVKELDLKR